MPEQPDRFTRFTEGARKALSYSQDEAKRASAPTITCLHMLIGLVREHDGIAATVLRAHGLTLPLLRDLLPTPPNASVGADAIRIRGMDPKTKRAIVLTVDAARRRQDDYLGTSHLLLGLLNVGDAEIAALLNRLGVFADSLRAQTRQKLDEANPFVTD